MRNRFKKNIIIIFCLILSLNTFAFSGDAEFNTTKACFENFIRCELTRTGAKNFFDDKPFTITMINFFDIKKEGDIIITTGAVKCFVVDKSINLFVAIGIKEIFEKKKVSYLVVRKHDFSILTTELMNYPYKERCEWIQYWVDID